MPALACTCGHRIGYGQLPCADEWLLIADTAFDGLTGAIETDDLYRRMDHLLKCPACGRLWVFWDGFDKPPTGYAREARTDGL